MCFSSRYHVFHHVGPLNHQGNNLVIRVESLFFFFPAFGYNLIVVTSPIQMSTRTKIVMLSLAED